MERHKREADGHHCMRTGCCCALTWRLASCESTCIPQQFPPTSHPHSALPSCSMSDIILLNPGVIVAQLPPSSNFSLPCYSSDFTQRVGYYGSDVVSYFCCYMVTWQLQGC